MKKAKIIKNGNVNLIPLEVKDPLAELAEEMDRAKEEIGVPDYLFGLKESLKYRNKKENMKRYVVIFLFTTDFEDIWLIEKQKPEWQKGCLNGIGGKIEEGESPFNAAHRELEEEAGIEQGLVFLREVGKLSGTNNDDSSFEVIVFTGKTELELVTKEEEEIFCLPVAPIKEHKMIENVAALIELCLYQQTGNSHFKNFNLNY